MRAKSEKFFDHFSQAALFFRSQSEYEQNHITDALTFELGMVQRAAIVDRMLFLLAKIDAGMANKIATGLGKKVPKSIDGRLNMDVGADAGRETETKPAKKSDFVSPALSMANTVKNTIKTRKIAILAGDGVNEADLNAMKKALTSEGATGAMWSRRTAASSQGRTAARFCVEHSLAERGLGPVRCGLHPWRREKRRGADGEREDDPFRERNV